MRNIIFWIVNCPDYPVSSNRLAVYRLFPSLSTSFTALTWKAWYLIMIVGIVFDVCLFNFFFFKLIDNWNCFKLKWYSVVIIRRETAPGKFFPCRSEFEIFPTLDSIEHFAGWKHFPNRRPSSLDCVWLDQINSLRKQKNKRKFM